MNDKAFNFRGALHDLLKQVPCGMKTTVREIAEALGDRNASGAVAQSLKSEEFAYAIVKITEGVGDDSEIFKDFRIESPLFRLMDLQREMSGRVVQFDCLESAELIAGVDVAYRNDHAYGACAVLDRNLRVVEIHDIKTNISFPYISGYLAFREGPVIEAAARRASHFDVLMIDGHGVAHPRGCGLASQVGVDLGCPTIGVASRPIVGQAEPSTNGWSPVKFRGKVVGAILKREGFSAVCVSVGHKISLETAVRIVRDMQVTGGTPEPIRVAHMRALEMKGADEPSA